MKLRRSQRPGLEAIALLVLALAACTSTPTPPLAVVATLVVQTAVAPTLLPTATVPEVPTDTPEPTDTATPLPTATPQPTTAPTAVPSAAPTTTSAVPTPAPAPEADALLKAFAKLKTAYPYRLTEKTVAGGSTLDRTTDFATADRWHTTWHTPIATGITEAIGIGSQTYWKVKGHWEAGSEPPPGAGSQVDVTALLLPALKDVRYTGQETVAGVPSFAFTFTLDGTSGMPISGQGKAWIGISDGVPLKVDLNGTAGGSPFESHLVYSYGVEFDIQPPVQHKAYMHTRHSRGSGNPLLAVSILDFTAKIRFWGR